MARLFRKRFNAALQEELFRRVKPVDLARIQTIEEYDDWLIKTVELDCWRDYSKNGLEIDRWAYFAKLINIVVYEIVSNREIFSEGDWERIRPFLHIPVDSTVTKYISRIDRTFQRIRILKGMTKEKYWDVQRGVRKVADVCGLPPIWFEAAWSA